MQYLFVTSVVFVVAWIIQVVMHLAVWQRPMRLGKRQRAFRPIATEHDMPGVSILVYSHNQGEALVRNLPVWLAQDYPTFEVIVVDDNSLDDTQDVLTMFDQRSDRLYHTRIDEKVRGMSHRKLAILLGIKAAHHDIILSTQAQCLPSSDQWIMHMVRAFREDLRAEVVLGPVAYQRRASFLSRFCGWDLFQRQVQLFGLTLAVKPYAGWGQNMAFRRQVFYANRNQAFVGHLHIKPGEDDLFVADVAGHDNVAVECTPEAVVTDQTSPLFLGWSMERTSRAFTSQRYALAPKMVAHLDTLTRYLTIVPGFGLLGYAVWHLLPLTVAPDPLLWILLGGSAGLLLLHAGLLVWTSVGSARMMGQRPMVSWPLLTALYMPFVNLWFRLKAGLQADSFSVSRVGLQ